MGARPGRDGRDDRARLERARPRRRRRALVLKLGGRAGRGRRSTAICSSPAAARRTRSASIARVRRVSAGSSSRRRSRDRRRRRPDERGRVRTRVARRARRRGRRRCRRRPNARRRRARSLVPPLGPRPGEVVARRASGSSRAAEEVKADAAELLAQRKATQPTNKRTFGSVFKNPSPELGAGRAIEECGLKGHRIGARVISPRHANFIENAGAATSADCAGADGRGPPPRTRAVRRRARARGAVPRAARAAAAVGEAAARGELGPGAAARRRRDRSHRGARPRVAARSSCAAHPSRPLGAASGSPLLVLAVGCYAAARETSIFAVQHDRVRGGTPRCGPRCALRSRRRAGREPPAVDGGAVDAPVVALPEVIALHVRPRVPAHAARRRAAGGPVLVVRRRGSDALLVAARGKVTADAAALPPLDPAAALGADRASRSPSGEPLVRATAACRGRARAARGAEPSGAASGRSRSGPAG